MFKRSFFLTATMAALPALTNAEPVTEVIVTVTREALPVSRLGQAVSVLDQRDIISLQSVTLGDLLVHTPSLVLTRNGGPGTAASAQIRGASADHTLYLIDGIRLNDPSQVGGGTNLGLIAAGDSARIEVLRGPLSTLWGSGALGGVVSITTRQPQTPLEGDVWLEGFEEGGSARANAGGKAGRFTWRLSGQALVDDGVSAFADGDETDAFSQTNLSAKAAIALSDSTTLRAFSLYSRSRNDLDGYPAPLYAFADTDEFGRTRSLINAVSLNHRSERAEHTLSLSETETHRHDTYADGSQFIARGRMQMADYHVVFQVSDSTRLTGGISQQREAMRIASPAPWDPEPVPLNRTVDTTSLYGQVTQTVGPATVALSARHDDSSSFGGFDFAQASVTAPAGPFRLRASVGTGVKTPSLYQLYSDYGTSGLVPETGITLDAGADYITDKGHVGVTMFTRTIRDKIDFYYEGCLPTQLYGCYSNVDRSRAQGIELTGGTTAGAWTLSGQYSVLDTRNESVLYFGKDLARAPHHSGSVDISYQASQRLSLGLGLRHVGDSFDNPGNTRRLKAYDLIDLRVRFALTDRVGLYGRIENAFDADYETASGYGQPGRRVWVGVTARLF